MKYLVVESGSGTFYVVGEGHCTALECKETGCSFPDCHDIEYEGSSKEEADAICANLNNKLQYEDNPNLDPQYVQKLMEPLDEKQRRRFLEGDWNGTDDQ